MAFVLYYITGAIGVTLGYHRVLTHRSAKLAKPLEYLTTVLRRAGPPGWSHRLGCPPTGRITRTPTRTATRTTAGAACGGRTPRGSTCHNQNRLTPAEMTRLAPDLADRRFFRFMERTTLLWQIALGIVLLAVGGWSWVVWGIFVRLVAVYHITWMVNSFTHSVGYRTFKTGDLSTNNWWVGLLAWGEGWHNNHHAFPFSARHGLRWFEVDLTWMTIRALRAVRLARDVKLPSAQMLAKLAFDPRPFLKVERDRAA